MGSSGRHFCPPEAPTATGGNPRGVSLVMRDLQTVALYDAGGGFVGIRRPGSGKPIEVCRPPPTTILSSARGTPRMLTQLLIAAGRRDSHRRRRARRQHRAGAESRPRRSVRLRGLCRCAAPGAALSSCRLSQSMKYCCCQVSLDGSSQVRNFPLDRAV